MPSIQSQSVRVLVSAGPVGVQSQSLRLMVSENPITFESQSTRVMMSDWEPFAPGLYVLQPSGWRRLDM